MSDFAETALDALKARGFEKAQVKHTTAVNHELQVEFGRPSLMRTTHQETLAMVGIADARRGSTRLNSLDDESLSRAVDELWEIAASSNPDDAFDIARAQPSKAFQRGPTEPDHDAMYDRLQELLAYGQAHHPTLLFRAAGITFSEGRETFLNSNGVDYRTTRGVYNAGLQFSAQEDQRVSSFNYTGSVLEALDQPLANIATNGDLMRQITEQIDTRSAPHKFTGSLVVTPDCLGTFLGFLLQHISDMPIIAGTSIYRESVGEAVADDALTLHSKPTEMAGGYFVTRDGFEAANNTIVRDGVLQCHQLSLYGANKTGGERAANDGGAWAVEPGSERLDTLIGGIEQGVLITRFSGGRPSEKGDFSGIAKNSYYIADGEVQFPLGETMIAGNLAELLRNISGISAERADFGNRLYPWVRMDGINVS